MPWRNIITIISLIGLLIILNFFLPIEKDLNTSKEKAITALTSQIFNDTDDENKLHLDARSACVFDAFKGFFLFEMEPDLQLPLASITKLMTTVVAKENLLDSSLVEITKEAILQEGDSGLNVGEVWTLNELIKVMLVSSSNDAAFAIASSLRRGVEPSDSTFVELMNNKAKELNLSQTYFLNSTGLDVSEETAGAYGSCKDMVNLFIYAMGKHSEILEATTKDRLVLRGRTFTNTNNLLPKLSFYLGGKTGFSDLAGGNLIIATNRGLSRPIIIMVLGSSEQGRFIDVEQLYNKFVK
jgi:D-alanyl-D-alanine carboxypeptidase (penicillin-binding protein 5/6)